jgi:hypothetical protein
MATSSVHVCYYVSDDRERGRELPSEVRAQHTEAKSASFIPMPLEHGEQLRGVEVYVVDSIDALPGQTVAGNVDKDVQGDGQLLEDLM